MNSLKEFPSVHFGTFELLTAGAVCVSMMD